MALPIRERHVAPARERRRNRRGQRTHPPALTTFGQPEPSGESTRRFVAPTRPLAMRLTNTSFDRLTGTPRRTYASTHQLAPAMTAEQSSGTAERRHRSGATSADHPEQSGAGVSERRMKASVDATGGGGTIRMCKGRVGRGGPTLVRDLGDASEQWTSHTNGTGAWKHGQSGRSSRRMVIREGPWPERKSPKKNRRSS
jgi:hypothetical protein